jgi:hypothetical protein
MYDPRMEPESAVTALDDGAIPSTTECPRDIRLIGALFEAGESVNTLALDMGRTSVRLENRLRSGYTGMPCRRTPTGHDLPGLSVLHGNVQYLSMCLARGASPGAAAEIVPRRRGSAESYTSCSLNIAACRRRCGP